MLDATVDRLIHSVLQPGFAGSERAPRWLLEAIERGLGGAIYFSHNIGDVESTAGLSAQLHAAGDLLIATDEEGGIVSRLGARGGSPHVGAAMLGRADDVTATREVGTAIGLDLLASGIDIDLAPVVDINSNADNPVIGVRSFGATTNLVSRHAVAYVEGLQATGVVATAKHFPGHGDTAVDSHVGVPRVDAPIETLRQREFAPFAAVIAAGARAVMTAHVIVPALDPERPATISATVLSVLRDELGFDGVIMSDALDMGAISDTIGLGQGCVQSLLAGADVLGLGNPVLGATDPHKDERVFTEAHSAIAAAVDSGGVPVQRLEEAAERITVLRQWRRRKRDVPTLGGTADTEVAQQALHVRGSTVLPGGPIRVLDVRRRRNVAAGALPAATVQAVLDAAPGSTLTSAFVVPEAVEGHGDSGDFRVRDALPLADVIVTGSPGQDPAEDEQRRAALRANPDALVLVMGFATGEEPLDGARNAIWTFGDSMPTARAVAARLTL